MFISLSEADPAWRLTYGSPVDSSTDVVMAWILLVVTAIISAAFHEVRVAPDVSDDYEIELWEKCRRDRHDDVPGSIMK